MAGRDYISTGAFNNLKGRSFEQDTHRVVFQSAESMNPYPAGVLDHWLYMPEFKILKNVVIGCHEIDVAVVNDKTLNLINNGASDIRISDRGSNAYLMLIECKDYEGNIGVDRAVDLLAKNYALRPNESIIVKKDDNTRFNWPKNFEIAGVRMLEEDDLEGVIKDIMHSGSSSALEEMDKYSVCYNDFSRKIKRAVVDKSRYEKRDSVIKRILDADFAGEDLLSAVNIKSLPLIQGNELTGACFNANAAVVKLDNAKYLHQQDLFIVNHTSEATLDDARQILGSVVLSKAEKGFLYFDKIGDKSKAPEFAELFSDKIELRPTSF
ncbi:MAG: hypothetical protein JW791_04030 [Nanoarchaeota archaeon]|nr:hypothetical protein [Nanoarchaeota archaeon]